MFPLPNDVVPFREKYYAKIRFFCNFKFFLFLCNLKVIFHLHLLQNIYCIPSVLQYNLSLSDIQ